MWKRVRGWMSSLSTFTELWGADAEGPCGVEGGAGTRLPVSWGGEDRRGHGLSAARAAQEARDPKARFATPEYCSCWYFLRTACSWEETLQGNPSPEPCHPSGGFRGMGRAAGATVA